MNVNFLGEAILGETEARAPAAVEPPRLAVAGGRGDLDQDLDDLFADFRAGPRPHRGHAVRPAGVALPHGRPSPFTRPDGAAAPKFVYLDMEEYRDMDLTAEAFMRTLDRPGWRRSRAGIVLQAYIPDSFGYQQRILPMGAEPRVRGRGPHHPAVVKGANMEVGTRARPRKKAGRRPLTRANWRPTPTSIAWSARR